MKTYFKVVLIFFLATVPLFSENFAEVSSVEEDCFYADQEILEVKDGDVFHIYRKTGTDENPQWNFIDSAFVSGVDEGKTKFEFVWYGEAQYIEEGDFLIPAEHAVNQRDEVVQTLFEPSETSDSIDIISFYLGGGLGGGKEDSMSSSMSISYSDEEEESMGDIILSMNLPFSVEIFNSLYLELLLNGTMNLSSSEVDANIALLAGFNVGIRGSGLSYYLGLGGASYLDESAQGLILDTGLRIPLSVFSENIELPLFMTLGADIRSVGEENIRWDFYLNCLYKL